MEAGTTRGDLVRNLMRGPTAIETRKVEKDSPAAHKAADRGARYVAGAATMTPRENAGGMGANCAVQEALALIRSWAPGRTQQERKALIESVAYACIPEWKP